MTTAGSLRSSRKDRSQQLYSALAVGAVLVLLVVRNFLVFVGLPAMLFTVAVRLVVGGLSHFDRGVAQFFPYSGPAITALGLLVMVDAVFAGSVSMVVGVPLFLFEIGIGLAIFGVALSIPTVRDRLTYRSLIVSAVLAAVVAGALDGLMQGRSVIYRTVFSVAVFALVPAGYALEQGYLCRCVATAVVGFTVFPVFIVPLGSTTLSHPLIHILFGIIVAVAIAFLGSPLLVVGASLSAGNE